MSMLFVNKANRVKVIIDHSLKIPGVGPSLKILCGGYVISFFFKFKLMTHMSKL